MTSNPSRGNAHHVRSTQPAQPHSHHVANGESSNQFGYYSDYSYVSDDEWPKGAHAPVPSNVVSPSGSVGPGAGVGGGGGGSGAARVSTPRGLEEEGDGEDEEQKAEKDNDVCGASVAVKKSCGSVVYSRAFIILNVVCTLLVLIGGELVLLIFPKSVDPYFGALLIFSMVVFLVEIVASCLLEGKRYIYVYLWLDLLSFVGVIPDVVAIFRSGANINSTGAFVVARIARVARLAARTSRLVRVGRLLTFCGMGAEDMKNVEEVDASPPTSPSAGPPKSGTGSVQKSAGATVAPRGRSSGVAKDKSQNDFASSGIAVKRATAATSRMASLVVRTTSALVLCLMATVALYSITEVILFKEPNSIEFGLGAIQAVPYESDLFWELVSIMRTFHDDSTPILQLYVDGAIVANSVTDLHKWRAVEIERTIWDNAEAVVDVKEKVYRDAGVSLGETVVITIIMYIGTYYLTEISTAEYKRAARVPRQVEM